MALRHLRLARLDRLAGNRARQVLGRYLAVAMHQHDQRARRLVLHHQGLDDRVFGHAQRGDDTAVPPCSSYS
jgi:hypothetical protein